MNKTTEALKLAEEALASCDAGDYSTGHVIHPSFNDKAVDKALAAIREALADHVEQNLTMVAEPVKQADESLVDEWYPLQEPVLWGNDKFAPHERPVDAEPVNQELLQTLERIATVASATVCNTNWIAKHARSAIAKAKGEI